MPRGQDSAQDDAAGSGTIGRVASTAVPPGAARSYVAALRVYEPLAAFAPAERRRLAAYAVNAPHRISGAAQEHHDALLAVLGVPPAAAAPATLEGAFVRRVGDVVLICPWRTRVRAWQALAEFRRGLPTAVADAFVPPLVAEAAEAELLAVRAADPDLRVPVQTSAWEVPLRWFVLFIPEERTLVLGRRTAGSVPEIPVQAGVRELTYVTAMSRARQRCARALATLRRTVEDGPVIDGVEALSRWLEEFHPRSLVELDYGGLVHLLDDETLRGDESVADVSAGLACLAAQDPDGAAAAYARVSERWRPLRAVERSN